MNPEYSVLGYLLSEDKRNGKITRNWINRPSKQMFQSNPTTIDDVTETFHESMDIMLKKEFKTPKNQRKQVGTVW